MLTGLKLALIQNWYPKRRTDSDLAKALEVDKSIVSKWINGMSEPAFDRKLQIARLLGLDSRQIFPEVKGSAKNG